MGEEVDAENTKLITLSVGLYLDKRLNKKPPWVVFCFVYVIFVYVLTLNYETLSRHVFF